MTKWDDVQDVVMFFGKFDLQVVLKIEVLIWVSFWRALKLNLNSSVEGLVQIQDVNPRV